MKKIFSVLSLILGLSISVSAQSEKPGEKPRAEQMTDKMKILLELTEEQYKSVYAINEESIKLLEEAGGREADRESRQKIRKQRLLKLNEILTPEQMGTLKDQRHRGAPKDSDSVGEKTEE